MSKGNPRVGNTAHYTAQCWVRFGYPEAHRFDTLRGRNLHRILGGVLFPFGHRATPILTRLPEWLHLRHYAMEQRVRGLSPTAVVEIGAGLSPRGLATALVRPELPYMELDLPNVVAAKRAQLGDAPLPENYSLTEGDLLAEHIALPRPLRDQGGAVVVTEGVIPYLAPPEKQRAFSNIAKLLRDSGGGYYVLEVYPQDFFERFPKGWAMGSALMGAFVGRSFEGRLCATVDQALGWLREAGFDEAQVFDPWDHAPEGLELPREYQPFQLIEARVGELIYPQIT